MPEMEVLFMHRSRNEYPSTPLIPSLGILRYTHLGAGKYRKLNGVMRWCSRRGSMNERSAKATRLWWSDHATSVIRNH